MRVFLIFSVFSLARTTAVSHRHTTITHLEVVRNVSEGKMASDSAINIVQLRRQSRLRVVPSLSQGLLIERNPSPSLAWPIFSCFLRQLESEGGP
ncbi:hypothetical protein BJ165DRAFT_109838 [Panaeolus papilionaceus]|nr:hypothetical protein BJ165DRAFT_109838 [Panaeolus papilionaceus]